MVHDERLLQSQQNTKLVDLELLNQLKTDYAPLFRQVIDFVSRIAHPKPFLQPPLHHALNTLINFPAEFTNDIDNEQKRDALLEVLFAIIDDSMERVCDHGLEESIVEERLPAVMLFLTHWCKVDDKVKVIVRTRLLPEKM